MSILKVQNLYAGYGGKDIVKNVSFEINPEELVGIVGANGSGKSTLIKALLNIIPFKGSSTLYNRNIKEYKARELADKISYIPQKSGIDIDISVLDVVLMGFNSKLGIFDRITGEMTHRAHKALDEVGILSLADLNYMEISEGQKQLCILARAIASGGNVMFMDEPDSALDFEVRYRVMELVKKYIVTNSGCGLVTFHDLSMALNLCDRILLIKDGLLIDTVNVKLDSVKEIELKLSKIYGNISVVELPDKTGTKQLVMLRNR